MKAQRSESPIEPFLGVLEGKVSKLHLQAKDVSSTMGNEAAQLMAYLDRLQELVPHCPKNRPISKLQLIQAVIDYIYDLEDVLLYSSEADKEERVDKQTIENDLNDQQTRSDILMCQQMTIDTLNSNNVGDKVRQDGVVASLWQYDDIIRSDDSFNNNESALLVMPSWRDANKLLKFIFFM